jgi:hypothetical protein
MKSPNCPDSLWYDIDGEPGWQKLVARYPNSVDVKLCNDVCPEIGEEIESRYNSYSAMMKRIKKLETALDKILKRFSDSIQATREDVESENITGESVAWMTENAKADEAYISAARALLSKGGSQ